MKGLIEFINENDNLDKLKAAVKKIGANAAADVVHSVYDNVDDIDLEDSFEQLDKCPDNDIVNIIYNFFPPAAMYAVIDAAK